MTYRQWCRACRRMRQQVVPDIQDKLPRMKTTNRNMITYRRVAMASTAAVAAAAVLVAGLCLMDFSPSGGSLSVVNPGVINPDISKQELPVHKAAQAAVVMQETVSADVFGAVDGYVGAGVMHLSADLIPKEHSGCSGVFYNMADNTMFCADHVVLEALGRQGQPAKQVGVHFYHPQHQVD